MILNSALDKKRKYMRLIKTIFISILTILIFHGISSGQINPDKPEIEIVSIQYEKSITVPIDFSLGINLDELGLDTEKEVSAPSGYAFLEVRFKINNLEIGNLEIEDIEITYPDGTKDIPTIFIDGTWNVSIQAFMSRAFYRPSVTETIPCTFVIAEKFRDAELMLEVAKFNLKRVIPRAFEFKKSSNIFTLTPDDQKDIPTPDDGSDKITDTVAGKPVSK
jgi:hypothetical protein